MNQIMQEYYPIFELYQNNRRWLMSALTDEDLQFQPGGDNPPLGALCRDIGEVQTAYIQSFKTFTQDFSYRHEQAAAMETSVEALRAWFDELDAELKMVVAALTEDELAKLIDRGPEFKIPPQVNLAIYTEALLIFYGRVTVYLRAMGKERSEQWQAWIG